MAEYSTHLEDYFSSLNISIEMLGNKQKEQLLKIDRSITDRLRRISDAKQLLREATINVVNIAKDAKIARGTIYNNSILNDYVEYWVQKSKADNNGNKETIDNLTRKNNELKDQIRGLVLRDIKEQNMVMENIKLTKEIETLSVLVENYEKELARLADENKDLSKKFSENKGTRILRMNR